ncbi:mTERF domain-containing protein 1, mitochondrial precursor [Camelus ferus]|nr:mTERF domain-containing protein 1, mitochondrial precursor [Camelus ferus]
MEKQTYSTLTEDLRVQRALPTGDGDPLKVCEQGKGTDELMILSLKGLDDLPPLSPLQPVSEEEAVQIIADPPLPPSSFTLRDYVDHSETLQKLVLLGVDLSKIEKHPDAANLLLRLDFEKDIKQILLFLKDLGIEDNQLGTFFTKNYAIFSEDLENLKTRVAYLQSKNFSKADIAQMVRNAPFLLSFSVERLDNRLGFFQKELELSVKKVYRLELGFKHNEIQHMITKIPKMLTANKRKLTETFDYVHNVMRVPHHIIVKFPQWPGLRRLMRDDTIYENDDVKEAIRRLPEHLYNERVFRIKRALDLSMRQQILPKEQWTKYEEVEEELLCI